MELLDQIKKAGLTDKESKVYLSLLELGTSFVSGISKKSGVSRTFCYDVLNKLCIMGLVNTTSAVGSKRSFTAEHPRRLVIYLDNQTRKFQNRKENIERLLPNFISLYKTENKPVIKFYEGVEGVKEAFWETLDQKNEILTCADVDEWIKSEFNDWLNEYYKERVKRNIKVRGLINPTEQSLDFVQTRPPRKVTEYRWLRSGLFPSLGCEVDIFGDKMIIAIVRKPTIAVMIDSKELTTVFRAMFEMSWQHAEGHSITIK